MRFEGPEKNCCDENLEVFDEFGVVSYAILYVFLVAGFMAEFSVRSNDYRVHSMNSFVDNRLFFRRRSISFVIRTDSIILEHLF